MNSIPIAKSRFLHSRFVLRLAKDLTARRSTTETGKTDYCLMAKFFTSEASPGSTSKEHKSASKEELEIERKELLEEASALTRSLYRICFRSVRHIRHGNEYDEKEFQEREQKRLEPKEKDSRMSMLSMLPPVDREDELRSRAEYYMQYTRENFVQESDCLSFDDWDAQHVGRYLFHLRRGDEHRKWLLNDMKFDDSQGFDHDRVDKFERRAMDYIRQKDKRNLADLSPDLQELYKNQSVATMLEDEDEDDEFTDDEEYDAQGLPEWYRNPQSQ